MKLFFNESLRWRNSLVRQALLTDDISGRAFVNMHVSFCEIWVDRVIHTIVMDPAIHTAKRIESGNGHMVDIYDIEQSAKQKATHCVLVLLK